MDSEALSHFIYAHMHKLGITYLQPCMSKVKTNEVSHFAQHMTRYSVGNPLKTSILEIRLDFPKPSRSIINSWHMVSFSLQGLELLI